MGDFDGQELIQAAIFDDCDLLSCLLEGECARFIDFRDTCGRTAIYTAVSNNSQQCLRLLLQRGGNYVINLLNFSKGRNNTLGLKDLCSSYCPVSIPSLDRF